MTQVFVNRIVFGPAEHKVVYILFVSIHRPADIIITLISDSPPRGCSAGFPGIVVIVTCNHEVSTASVLNIFDVLFDIVTPDVAKGAKSRSDSYQKNQR